MVSRASSSADGLPTMKRAQFVAVRIAKVSEIRPTWANTGRIFDGCAAIRHPGFVPGVGLFGTCHCEADRAAVGVRGCLAIDRFAHHEPSAVMHVDQPASGILLAGLAADRAEQRIVEFLRPGNVVAADHHMAEHSAPSTINVACGPLRWRTN